MPDRLTCKDCVHWDEKGYPQGWCRLNPPTVVSDIDGNTTHGWTPTYAKDWCAKLTTKEGILGMFSPANFNKDQP